MSETAAFRVADLPQNRPTAFSLRPDADACRALATELDLSALRKLTFTGQIESYDKSDWLLTGRLGATVVQPCVVTLAPVTTRIETDVRRLFVAGMEEPDAAETEMPEDENREALGKVIDPAAVLVEELALALPDWPRSPGAELGEAVFTEAGKTPMRDEDTRPFAGLSSLRDRLRDDS